MTGGKNSGQQKENHFSRVVKMVRICSGVQKEVRDYELYRYAIHRNSHRSKRRSNLWHSLLKMLDVSVHYSDSFSAQRKTGRSLTLIASEMIFCQQPSFPPMCPKCGIQMVLRTGTKGAFQGKSFYGCSNYPKCRMIFQDK